MSHCCIDRSNGWCLKRDARDHPQRDGLRCRPRPAGLRLTGARAFSDPRPWERSARLVHPPSWLLNLQADPDVGVQIGRKKFSARASVASAEERERLWPRVNRHNMGLAPIMHPGARGRYDVYQRHTTRLIPLVLLEPSTEEARSPAGADATNSTA
jgi:deazaflavin-dependent oxidoreductase (nitroreductase family)